jgi:hypothetical protein
MKIYNSFEDWKKDWTPEKQKLYQETKKRKYGKIGPNVLINDRELSEITGKIILKIPVIGVYKRDTAKAIDRKMHRMIPQSEQELKSLWNYDHRNGQPSEI